MISVSETLWAFFENHSVTTMTAPERNRISRLATTGSFNPPISIFVSPVVRTMS